MFCKKKKPNNEKQVDKFKANLTQEELESIDIEVAKLMYENVKKICIEIKENDLSLKTKAENLFKIFYTISAWVIGLYFYKDKAIQLIDITILLLPFGYSMFDIHIWFRKTI